MNVSYCTVTLPAGIGVLNAVGRKNILMGINVLSLFDGMACGLVALKRAGIQVDNYFASEIDKYAMQIAKKNHPEIQHIGDVTKIDLSSLPKIDLLIGGSPCQGFSNAGQGLNFDDPRSKLFFTYVQIRDDLHKKNPELQFLLENVKMKQEWQDIINDEMGVFPVEINSSLVSAQNRKRLYWANWKIEQPEDLGLVLRDIIEEGEVDREKSYCIDANYFKGGNPRSYFEDGKRQLVFEHQSHKRAMVRVGTASDISGHDYLRRIYSPNGKSPTINAHAGGNTEPKIMIVPEATKKGYVEILPNEGVDLRFINSKTRRGRSMKTKINALTSGSDNNIGWYNGETYRKLTPLECERLQTLPDGYTEGVSNTQRYKMIGNGWTIDVITHILKSNPNLM